MCSCDAVLLAHLRGRTGVGRVDSVFRHVVNVSLPGGQLMALASRDVDDAPWTLVLDLPDWTGHAIEAGRPVAFADGTITVAGLRVDTGLARSWSPSPVSLDGIDLAASAAGLDRLVHAHGRPGGMLASVPATAMDAALGQRRDLLVGALLARDPPAVRRGVLALLGLGPGLTPAGDDFLTGLALLSSLTGSRLDLFARVLREVLAEHAGRTTPLSATALAEALDGRARASLLDVLHAMAGGLPIGDPVHRVLATGHTSGTDTLSGLVAGLHLEREP